MLEEEKEVGGRAAGTSVAGSVVEGFFSIRFQHFESTVILTQTENKMLKGNDCKDKKERVFKGLLMRFIRNIYHKSGLMCTLIMNHHNDKMN